MVVSADCHGVASPFYPELRQLVQRFLNYGAVHCIVALPMLARYSTYNLLTGQENAVPEGGCPGGAWQPQCGYARDPTRSAYHNSNE